MRAILPAAADSTPTAHRSRPPARCSGEPHPRARRAQRALVVLGIVVLAFNLRPAAVSVGPVLGEISDGLGMSAAETGVLTSLPVLAFAVFGALAPRLARLIGLHRLTLVALLCVVGGLAGRPRCRRCRRSWCSPCSPSPGWPRPTCCFPRWSSCTSRTGSA